MPSKIICQVIDWRITAKCNSTCEYCYGSAALRSLESDEKKVIINKIVQSKCKNVCISGGEPLLDDDAVNIITELHNRGIAVFLSTNGTKYFDYRHELEGRISKLSLPLDGYDEDSNGINGRCLVDSKNKEGSFTAVKNILDYYTNTSRNFSIKVGTVLTKRNANVEHFCKIYEFLKHYSIDQWKIYEFIPEGRGADNKDDLILSKEELEQFLNKIIPLQNKIREDNKFPLVIATRKMRNSAYFIIQPDGTVIIPIDSFATNIVKESVVGDLKKNSFERILEEWRSRVIDIRYNTNLESRMVSRPMAKRYIDQIDKKIVYYLDRDPLQTNDQLLERLLETCSVSMEELQERIDKLYGIRAIKHIMPIINVAQFGLEVFLLNLYFKHNDQMGSIEISEILSNDESIAWVSECYEYEDVEDIDSSDGYIIFRISIFAENNRVVEQRISKLRNYFKEVLFRYEYDSVPDKYICGQGFLIKNTNLVPNPAGMENDHIVLEQHPIPISEKEFRVLSAMAMTNLSRFTIGSIANNASMNECDVKETIDSLLAKTVINKFQVVTDPKILGYQWYEFFISFDEPQHKKEFENYVKNLDSVTHINTLNGGSWDIDVEINVEQANDCSTIWSDLDAKFGSYMRSSKITRIKKEHKFYFLIPVTIEAMKRSVKYSIWRKLFNKIRG